MLYSHIKVILLLVPITQITGAAGANKKCDNRVCNYEYPCELRAGAPYCQCVGKKYFTGKYCTKQADNCSPNPCKGATQCTNALGQPICGPCPAGYGGYLCDVLKADIFTKLYLHHNRFGYQAADERLLFILESLGSAAFLLEFHTDTYAIEAFKTDPKQPVQWHRSSNLAAVAQKFGLHHPEKIPYRNGYYHVTTARFWTTGLQDLRLKVTDLNSRQTYMEHAYQMQIFPLNEICRPELTLAHGANPFKPFMVDVARFTNIHMSIKKRCWNDSELQFDWNVYTSTETAQLYTYGKTRWPRLKMPPYPPWASHLGELMQSYLIHITVKETSEGRKTFTVVRCYVFVQSKPVVASIVGGIEREVDVRAPFYLDGSPSRDLAVSPTSKSSLNYIWKCESQDDPSNRACAQRMGQDKVLTIPAGSLKHKMTYKFTLEVQSQTNIFSQNQYTQTITPVTGSPLYVEIECVRNCAAWKFILKQSLHLKAHCLNCDFHTAVKYTWTVNGKRSSQRQRLIIENAKDEHDALTVQVQLDYQGRQGKATIKLARNSPPIGGRCSISPDEGQELQTIFKVFCENFRDTDMPLLYEFSVNDLILERTTDSSATFLLLSCDVLDVAICDSFNSCTKTRVDVSVDEIQDMLDVEEILENPKRNLKTKVKDGDITNAIAVAVVAVRYIDTSTDVEAISSRMQRLPMYSLLDIEQFNYFLVALMPSLGPIDNEKSVILYQLLSPLAEGFEYVLDDGEAREMRLDVYRDLQNFLASAFEALTTKTVDFNVIHTLEPLRVHTYNRMNEVFYDVIVSDTDILKRIYSFVKVTFLTDRCLRLLGIMGTYLHEPDEPKSESLRDSLQLVSFAFESMATQTINTSDKVAKIVLDSAVIFDLQSLLGTRSIFLQVMTTPKDIRWWFPDFHGINTGVLYLSAFSSTAKYKVLKAIALPEPFEITLELNGKQDSTADSRAHMLGRLENNADMNIFQMRLPKNTLLAITFVSADVKLRVLLSLKKKPTGFRTKHSNDFIKKGGSSAPLVVINRENSDLDAYLSVLPAEDVTGGHALFAFVPELRQCLSWSFELTDPQWTTDDCWPKATEYMTDGMHCYCKHMSTYAGKVFPTGAFSLYGVGNLLDHMPINWIMLSAEIAIGLVFIGWVFMAYALLAQNRERLVIYPKDDLNKDVSNGEVILRFTTGGYRNASSTAGLIVIMSTMEGLLKFKIYQNPKKPQLQRHSTCTVILPLNPKHLTRPYSLFIRHDGGGRYPSWYCRFVEINYPGNIQPVYIQVNSWVDDTTMHLMEGVEPKRKNPRWRKFTDNLDTICTNWFFCNPLFGPWKYGNLTANRFERTLIWMLKVGVALLVVLLYFGWTMPSNYEEERDHFRYLSASPLHTLVLSIINFIVGSVLQFGIEYCMYAFSSDSKEI